MGFIDWHGNKQDQYEDILEFAKMKERMKADNFGSQMKKKQMLSSLGCQSCSLWSRMKFLNYC